MARRRSKDLADARAELAGAMGRYDDATYDHLQAERKASRGGDERAREAVLALRTRVRHAAAMRRALGRFLVVLHDTPRDEGIQRELEAIAPGLAADRRQLDEDRRSE